MVFILPNRPEKENPLNNIIESLTPVAGKVVTGMHRTKLEKQLKSAKNPAERAAAIESIMLSPHYEDKEKATLERMFHQERQQAQQSELMQSIFGPRGQEQQMEPSQGAEMQQRPSSLADLGDEQIADRNTRLNSSH